MSSIERIKDSVSNFLKRNQITELEIGTDEKLVHFEEKVMLWLNNVSENEQSTFLNLLDYFEYYGYGKIKNGLKSVYSKFICENENHTSTIYLPLVSPKGIFNGAYEIFPLFRGVNKINKEDNAMSYNDFSTDKINAANKIVFVDDIIGSGTTVIKTLQHLNEKIPILLANKEIHILCLVAFEKGLNRINAFALENGVTIKIFPDTKHKKSFSSNYIFSDEDTRVEAKRLIKNYETYLANRPDDRLGYKRSEGLVSFLHNTPNNTLSIFWNNEKHNHWSVLFEREGKSCYFKLDNNNKNELAKIKKRKESKTNLKYNLAIKVNEAMQGK